MISEKEEKDTVRDIPQCPDIAGVIPCQMVDFSTIATPGQFVDRFEKIGAQHLSGIFSSSIFFSDFSKIPLKGKTIKKCEWIYGNNAILMVNLLITMLKTPKDIYLTFHNVLW